MCFFAKVIEKLKERGFIPSNGEDKWEQWLIDQRNKEINNKEINEERKKEYEDRIIEE